MGHNKKILVVRGLDRRQARGLLRGTIAALIVSEFSKKDKELSLQAS